MFVQYGRWPANLQNYSLEHQGDVCHVTLYVFKTLSSGVQVFFRGASVNAIRGFPMSATMFLIYELSLQFFRSL